MFHSFFHNNGPSAAGETFSDSRSYPLTNTQEASKSGLNGLTSSVGKPQQQQPAHLLNSYSIAGSNPLMRAGAMGTTSDSMNPNMSNMNEHIRVSGMGTSKPLDLAGKYIDHLQHKDGNTPILDERSYYNSGVDYNFSREKNGLGAFTPFERKDVFSIPEEILQEFSTSETRTDMGIFPELNRCWITIDSKLILWNIDNNNEYQVIDDIKHTIRKVALVKPKPNTFVPTVKHLLLICTTMEVFMFAISLDKASNELSVFNTHLSVPIQGIDVIDIVSHERSGRIFFAGQSSGLNIWELQYSGSDDWFNSKCNKVCLTKSALSSFLPTNVLSQIPGVDYVQSFFENNSNDSGGYSQETIIQLTIDQQRGIIYSLSSKSTIKAYLIAEKSLEGPMSIEPAYISRIIGTTTARAAPILSHKYLKIVKISSVTPEENNNLFLVALTVGGVRLYFNGSMGRYSIEALRLESIKFPPSSVTPEVIQQELLHQQQEQAKRSFPFFSNLMSSEPVLLKFQKKSSVLLETSKASTIISPGIFFSAVIKSSQQTQQTNKTENFSIISGTTTNSKVVKQPAATLQHKLFVSVPDYGILKTHGKYVENATFLETTGPVQQIIPLSGLFNATTKPQGFANEFATQYTSESLRVAVLTNTSVEIYKYRTPDEIFEDLIDNPLPFVLNYGAAEACSTALFVTCKSNKSEKLRSNALTFLTMGIPGVVDIKPVYNRYSVSTVSSLLSKPSLSTTTTNLRQLTGINQPSTTNKEDFNLDDVILSPRFYGIALLITRLLRDIWGKQVFTTFTANRTSLHPYNTHCTSSITSINDHDITSRTDETSQNKNIISKVSISKDCIEYYLSSVNILNEFFVTYGDSISQVSIPYLLANNSNGRVIDKTEEVANQAESIAINALIKLVQSVKEGLSFLNVLYEESEVEGFDNQFLGFKDIISFVNLDVQQDLIKLDFKDLFTPSDKTKSLVREILLSIINRNITKGASIEYTATALQERCGSFCSASDILGFRAIEHLRRAKEIGLRNYDSLNYHLKNATALLEQIVDDLSIEKLREAVSMMLSVNYFPKSIEFLLNIANSMDKGNLACQYVANGFLENDERKKYYDKRILVYDLVFETLIKVDELTEKKTSSKSQNQVSISNDDEVKMRKKSYEVALKYNDKLFHYHMYDWLVSQNREDKLLEIETPFILPYLMEKASSSLKISNILWVYYSRRSKFFESAEILYHLATSNFNITLFERIEFLSRANGFCNSVSPLSQKQRIVQLASRIQDACEVAGIQEDILSLVYTDVRIDSTIKDEITKILDGKILSTSELFNDFAVPLSYHEIALFIFKIADFRDHEMIMAKWDELFQSLRMEFKNTGKKEDSMNFINLLSNVLIKIGKNVQDSEFIFPIFELFPIICNFFYETLPKEHIIPGSIVSVFITAGVSFNKMYYILKELIETSDSDNSVFNREMTWLIHEWYKSDRKFRDIITYDDIIHLKEYNVENDPIEKYVKNTGNNLGICFYKE
ncbi:nup170p [Saccharomyces arboricola H-6]|uniref:Nup170p n=1 Tax=Saccharomyces arboricola (strain H-6 / AS 2.3317 / CBS 10644) TaxID=1160507 RepID=J8Q7N0_SACAR|nr:nup170p [Saccharomyces arboricola H-6]